ncbi:hypothetical protein FSARC_12866 [Fusarium sarcochroum]|uniref:Pyruvate decarboxylase n=1 Tax=Fusarium sarcochroum TaxID=1208366 RepID=A0A8H4T5I9_9HYPO|nr:hypothetical protein FSARC_12866 [Fusarium sarcochroum]
MDQQISVPEYLFLRLIQLGAGSVHGVPGDYNLTACDYVTRTGLRWVGNANELNAGYAADAYARIKGIGVLFTSFGPGELSAFNAIAGAYAEKAPVVHIVGTPPRSAQKAGSCLHHTLGDGNFRAFANIYKTVTVAQADLSDPATAGNLIDQTLQRCILESRPVYFTLPLDMVPERLTLSPNTISLTNFDYNKESEDRVVDALVANIQHSERPLIIVDGFTARFGVREDVNELVRVTGISTLTTPFGNGAIDSSLPNYHGIYHGGAGPISHSTWVQGCDLVLRFGPLDSDINTFASTALPNDKVTVVFEKHSVRFGQDLTGPVSSGDDQFIKSLLKALLVSLNAIELSKPVQLPHDSNGSKELLKKLPVQADKQAIDQYNFWLRMSEFLRPGDYVLTETGTSLYGGQSLALPDDTTLICSAIWLSIGYMLSAAQGVSLAHRELVEQGSKIHGRTILFEGEGSLQMTAQAISDIIRNRLDVTIFVLNNNGYTVERIIHGFDEGYNDIQPWRYLEAPSYFGASLDDPEYPVRTFRAENWGELRSALQDSAVQGCKGLTMIEVVLDVADCPTSLSTFADLLAKKHKGGW